MFDISYSALMPPMCLLLAIPVGAVIALRWRKTGIALVFLSSLLLYAFCTPFLSERLLVWVEDEVPPPSSDALASAQAIVVLEGDMKYGDGGPESDDVGPLTLQRLRLAAQIYRRRPLPVVMTGGAFTKHEQSGAAIMARVFDRDYGIATKWLEAKAENTFQNGAYSAEILKAHQITKAIIVTQSWHMPRAVWSFEHAGIVAIPAPDGRVTLAPFDWTYLTPDYTSFSRSFFAIHEMLGLAYYHHRYGSVPASSKGDAKPGTISARRTL